MQPTGFLLVCFLLACAQVYAQENKTSDTFLESAKGAKEEVLETFQASTPFERALKRMGNTGPPSEEGSSRVPRQTNRMSREELRRRTQRLIDQKEAMKKFNAQRDLEHQAAAAQAREEAARREQQYSSYQSSRYARQTHQHEGAAISQVKESQPQPQPHSHSHSHSHSHPQPQQQAGEEAHQRCASKDGCPHHHHH